MDSFATAFPDFCWYSRAALPIDVLSTAVLDLVHFCPVFSGIQRVNDETTNKYLELLADNQGNM